MGTSRILDKVFFYSTSMIENMKDFIRGDISSTIWISRIQIEESRKIAIVLLEIFSIDELRNKLGDQFYNDEI